MTASAALPLSGIKIVELHAIGPVPYAGQLLRRMGAQIQRVSPPADPGLGVNTREEFDLLNAGKERVYLLGFELKRERGRAAFTLEESLDELARLADSAGLEVVGQARCDTLRIDQTPAGGVLVCDSIINVSMDGVLWQIPCKIAPS